MTKAHGSLGNDASDRSVLVKEVLVPTSENAVKCGTSERRRNEGTSAVRLI
jgi:hypothetical protein